MQQPNISPPDNHFAGSCLHPPDTLRACDASARILAAQKELSEKAPRVHCLTNAVTMNDVANILLAIGGSAIMAQCGAEAAQITALCQATLLNTGTPSDEKFAACHLAGARANALGHPVVLDPVGVGASTYRQENIKKLLSKVHPELIRCNLEEALTLLALLEGTYETGKEDAPAPCVPAMKAMSCEIRHGGVESGMCADNSTFADTAARLAMAYRTSVLISGSTDAISDGRHTALVTGGDARISRVTGGGCMLSAICAAFLAAGKNGYDAALDASIFWKRAAECAGEKTDADHAGMGSFRMHLFDAITNPDCNKS